MSKPIPLVVLRAHGRLVVELRVGGDVAEDHGEVCARARLASDVRLRVTRKARIDDRVRDLVGELAGVGELADSEVKRNTSGFSSEQPSVFSIAETFALISVNQRCANRLPMPVSTQSWPSCRFPFSCA